MWWAADVCGLLQLYNGTVRTIFAELNSLSCLKLQAFAHNRYTAYSMCSFRWYAYFDWVVGLVWSNDPERFISHAVCPADLIQTSPAPHFKTFQVFLIYFSEVPKFHHQTNLCSKCSTSLVSSNLRLISWWNEPYPCWMLLLPWQIRVWSLQISITRCCRGPSFNFILVCTGTVRNRQRFAQRRPVWRKIYRIHAAVFF